MTEAEINEHTEYKCITTLDDPSDRKRYGEFTPEELEPREKERERLYPKEDPNYVHYLRYPCAYCRNLFFLRFPTRSKGLEPLHLGYVIRPKHSKKVIGICMDCMMEISKRNDIDYSFNLEGWGK